MDPARIANGQAPVFDATFNSTYESEVSHLTATYLLVVILVHVDALASCAFSLQSNKLLPSSPEQNAA